MKVVLLAGGRGTRISELSEFMPKPLIELGDKPIIWHIMKEYSYYGFNEFVICGGYKQEMIKQWFADYFLNCSDVTFDMTGPEKTVIHHKHAEPWKVTVVDTGINTNTGGRLAKVREYIDGDTFMLTYGDGVCDVDIRKLVDYHNSHDKIATLTAVKMKQEKGALDIDAYDNTVRAFREKQQADAKVINAGYMVLNTKVFDYLTGDDCVLEAEPMQRLVEDGQLKSFRHEGFWQCMDNMNEKIILEQMLERGIAPWVRW